MRSIVQLFATAGVGLPLAASACTLCRSPAARLVRARVFDVSFPTTLVEVALPVLVMALVLVASARSRMR